MAYFGALSRGTKVEQNSTEEPRPGLFKLIQSTLAAAIGIQSRKNFERDVSFRSPVPFILFGLLGTALFILTVVGVVKLIIHLTGAQ